MDFQTGLYGDERTRYLNRVQVLLTILRAPQDYVGQRFLLGAANKALVVTEPISNEEAFKADKHLVVAGLNSMAGYNSALLGQSGGTQAHCGARLSIRHTGIDNSAIGGQNSGTSLSTMGSRQTMITPHKKILILGTGTFAMDVTDMISDISGWEVSGFVASMPPYAPGMLLLDRPVYWVDEVPRFADTHLAFCALVTTRRYQFIEQVETMGFRFATVIHPSARVSRQASIGEGTLISGGVQVAAHTQIGRHVVINRGALIGHHNTINDFATISPGANLAGTINVGRRAWIGLGANVLEKLSIGACAVVGAGSLVMKDVPERVKVMGVPAVVIEQDVDGL